MQPRQFLVGQRTAADAPIPTVSGIVLNAVTGAVLLWLVPRLLPAGTPWAIRFGIALVGFCFLFLIARFDFWAIIFRAMGFAVEKLWDCPIAARTLGDFWGRRWNRIVSGGLREIVFLPVRAVPAPRSRSWPCSSTAACITNSSASWPDRDMADRLSTSCCNVSVWPSRIRAGAPLAPRSPLAGTCVDVRRRRPARRPVPPSRPRRRISRADARGRRRAGTGTLAGPVRNGPRVAPIQAKDRRGPAIHTSHDRGSVATYNGSETRECDGRLAGVRTCRFRTPCGSLLEEGPSGFSGSVRRC